MTEIDRELRKQARRNHTKNYEAVDSSAPDQKGDPVPLHQNEGNTVSRSGTSTRNSKKTGQEALQRSREALRAKDGSKYGRPRTQRDAGEDWFKKHKKSVEQMIGEPLKIDADQVEAPQIPCDEIPQEHIDFENYRPVVDDDAEEYVPLSER